MHAAEQQRPDVAEQRAHWHEQLSAVSGARLWFVDESGANTKMARRGGRSAIGRRLVCPVPFGRYETQTLIAAVGLDGVRAPWVFSGAMNGEMFLAWVRQGLAPKLQPGDWVIMDNLATHKIVGVKEAIEAVGAHLRYLPPYSPDFNPIENMWSKIKQLLRSLAPRTAEDLLRAAALAFAAISTTDCRGFFLYAQYAI
jgi:transposase